ncbi:MAG: type IV pilus assembly protein PilM [Bacillota bacterium]
MGLFKTSSAVGLELDTGVIRVAELNKSRKRTTLVRAGQLEIPETAVVEGAVVQIDTVAIALEKMWSHYRFTSRNVVMGVANHGVLMRLATFPKIKDSQLEQVVRFQAGEYFPIPVSQLVLDFAVVGTVEEGAAQKVEVLLVAVRRDLLAKALAALERARLTPVVIDASPLAAMRTLPRERLLGTAAIVDIANGLSSLLVVVGGVPRFARFIPVSLQSHAYYDVNSMSVEVVAGPSQQQKSWQPGEWETAFINEIRSSLTYAEYQGKGPIDSMFLSGPGARIVGLKEMLQEKFGIPVHIIQPCDTIALKTHTGADIETLGPDFTVSVGLALRGLEE